jgi:hypothetical protein
LGLLADMSFCFWGHAIKIYAYFEEISEHGIFHGITNFQENEPLNIKDSNGLFTIEWE